MTQKEVLSARLDEKTSEQLDEFADENSLSRSEAAERLIHQSLRIENGDVEIVPVSPDGGTDIENAITDARQTIENQSEKIENQKTAETRLWVTLTLAIFWLGAHIIFSVGSLVSIGTGVLLMAGLVYSYYRYLRV